MAQPFQHLFGQNPWNTWRNYVFTIIGINVLGQTFRNKQCNFVNKNINHVFGWKPQCGRRYALAFVPPNTTEHLAQLFSDNRTAFFWKKKMPNNLKWEKCNSICFGYRKKNLWRGYVTVIYPRWFGRNPQNRLQSIFCACNTISAKVRRGLFQFARSKPILPPWKVFGFKKLFKNHAKKTCLPI